MWYLIAFFICLYIVWWIGAIYDGDAFLFLTIALHIFAIAVIVIGTILKLIFGRG